MTLLWFAMLLLFLYALLMRYYRNAWKSLETYIPRVSASHRFLSIVVPARNEAAHIEALLASLAAQDYPHDSFEILLADDFSTDDTVVRAQRTGLQNLVILQPQGGASTSSKKKAIAAAVEKAKGELIITTDADCILHPRWLSTIHSFYLEKGSSFIAAPVRFTYDDSGLQQFQALDFLVLQGITAASVSANFHTMCNGANLAYTKEAFHAVNGFAGIDHVATGDDMLLMYKIWKRDPSRVHYLKSREAIVTTPPMPTLQSFFAQRKRWASKSLVYDDKRIIAVLFLVLVVNLLFPIMLVTSFWNPYYLLYALLYALIKALIEWRFVSDVADFYGSRRLMSRFLLFQPLHMLYTVFAGMAGQLGGYEWKGRKTK